MGSAGALVWGRGYALVGGVWSWIICLPTTGRLSCLFPDHTFGIKAQISLSMAKWYLSRLEMFRRRPHYRRRGGGGNFGLLLLAFQLFSFLQYLMARDEFLPTTLVTLGVNILVFIQPEIGRWRQFAWPTISSSCISVQGVWYLGGWERVFLAPVVHGDTWHLYYNMASFMWKARSLEKYYESWYFAYIIAVFTPLTSVTYLAINYILGHQFNTWSYITNCAVGFSGVIFALKVLTTHLQPEGRTAVFGIPMPNRLSTWMELVVISVLFPNVSFVGHLAGILVGMAFVSGPLKAIMDTPLNIASGNTNIL